MKPVTISTPSRIYRRGNQLRRNYQQDQQNYYLSRIIRPETELGRLYQIHRRTLSHRIDNFRREARQSLESKTLAPFAQANSSELRQRRSYYCEKYHLNQLRARELPNLSKSRLGKAAQSRYDAYLGNVRLFG